jgi:hypothetical protein
MQWRENCDLKTPYPHLDGPGVITTLNIVNNNVVSYSEREIYPQMKFKFLLVLFFSTIHIPTGCRSATAHQQNPDSTKTPIHSHSDISIEDLENSDVSWNGNFFGLQPQLSDRAKSFDCPLTSHEKTALISALEDENRYVIAHVLLSKSAGEDIEFDASQWNGLKVALKADGSVCYPEGQREGLLMRWGEE